MMAVMKRMVINHLPKQLLNKALSINRKKRLFIIKLDMTLFPRKMYLFCPCCGLKYRSFVEGDYLEYPKRFNPIRYKNTRQDVLCPYCKSLPRHRILALWCEENIVRLKGTTILYFAPEYSMTLWMKRNSVSYVSADIKGNVDLELDIQNTKLPDGSYDVIICNHVLEHVDDYRAALTEVHRVLKPKGLFICSFPMDPKVELLDEEGLPLTDEDRLQRYGQNDHKRVFGMKAIMLLKEVGFDVESICGESYPKEILPVIGPADYDMNCLFKCIK